MGFYNDNGEMFGFAKGQLLAQKKKTLQLVQSLLILVLSYKTEDKVFCPDDAKSLCPVSQPNHSHSTVAGGLEVTS